MAKSNTANISIRMDADLKASAEAFYEELGMNLSTAFNIFVRQCLREGRIPFTISAEVPNAVTLSAMREAEQLSRSAEVKTHRNLDELFAEWDAL